MQQAEVGKGDGFVGQQSERSETRNGEGRGERGEERGEYLPDGGGEGVVAGAAAGEDEFGDGLGDEPREREGDAAGGEGHGCGDDVCGRALRVRGAAVGDEALDIRAREEFAASAPRRFRPKERVLERAVDYGVDCGSAECDGAAFIERAIGEE